MITQVDMDFNQTCYSYMNNTHCNTSSNKYLNK